MIVFSIIAIIIVVLVLIFFSAPFLAIILAVMAIPIVLAGLIPFSINKIIPTNSPSRTYKVIIISCFILFVPSQSISLINQVRINELTKDDHNELSSPLNYSSIAIRRFNSFKDDTTSCDGLCIHLLISGAAERVIIVKNFDIIVSPHIQDIGIAYHLEKRKNCPVIKYGKGSRTLRITNDRENYYNDKMNRSISNGQCLIKTSTNLASADIVLSTASLRRVEDKTKVKLPIFSHRAGRITLHKRKNEIFVEQLKWTGLSYYPPLPFFPLPNLTLGGRETYIGYEVFNPKYKYSSQSYIPRFKYISVEKWTEFLADQLGINFKQK